MQTITCAIALISKDCQSRYPRPVRPAIISAATTISHAMPMPTAIPVTIDGTTFNNAADNLVYLANNNVNATINVTNGSKFEYPSTISGTKSLSGS